MQEHGLRAELVEAVRASANGVSEAAAAPVERPSWPVPAWIVGEADEGEKGYHGSTYDVVEYAGRRFVVWYTDKGWAWRQVGTGEVFTTTSLRLVYLSIGAYTAVLRLKAKASQAPKVAKSNVIECSCPKCDPWGQGWCWAE